MFPIIIMSHPHDAPDLNSVLQTLSALSNPQQSSPTTPSHPTRNEAKAAQPQPQHQIQPPSTTHSPSGHPEGSPASSITTWPAALRHVMRTVSQNEEMQRRIRFLIQRQHDHEKQWWQGREALVEKQRTRGDKKKELDAVLRSVGAPVDTSTAPVFTAEQDQTELTTYDAKVYKASRQMADAMAGELRALQIPFFSIRSALVRPPRPQSQSEKESKMGGGGADMQGSGPGTQTLSRDELAVLQRKMLELLMDLCQGG